MSFLDSRFIGLVDVPDPQSIEARFVYNFFVPDERTNKEGNPRFQGVITDRIQRSIDSKVMEFNLPRFVEIQFDQVNSGDGNIEDLGSQPILSEEKQNVDTEENISSDNDASFRFRDTSIRSRIKGKAEILAKMMNADMNDVNSQISTIANLNENIDVTKLQKVLSPEGAPGVSYVNEVGDLFKIPVFTQAATLSIDMLLERRLLRACFSGNFRSMTPTRSNLLNQAQQDALKFLPVASNDAGEDSFEPEFRAISSEEVDEPSDEIRSLTVGYIIERQEIDSDGSSVGKRRRYYIDDKSDTRFIDTKIAYGKTYSYTLRTVALLEMTIESDGETNLTPGFYRVRSLVASRPSPATIIQTIERRPPMEPDGVFYRFNYSQGRGLMIRWQIPVGKQRDVKYFQIFRRKTIYDPFTCIAEIDFDDSKIRSSRAESALPARVHRVDYPQTIFLDSEFTRDSNYIYAVAALDAHGLSSGYSAQSQVSFDKIKNKVNLKTISKSGAPKQYPNFFIDPDLDDNIFVDSLTQDSMQSSKKFSIRVYFDPDTVRFTSREGLNEMLFVTDENVGVYKFHLLNIDRQKAAITEIRIDDLR
tara:strand:- start:2309 stop:4075 length:1767 start_codon:yes stop_codon:yes gene_type:complete